MRELSETDIRDIRGDLRERAAFLEREIVAARDDYDRAVERLEVELKARISAIGTTLLMQEYRTFLANFLDSDRIR